MDETPKQNLKPGKTIESIKMKKENGITQQKKPGLKCNNFIRQITIDMTLE